MRQTKKGLHHLLSQISLGEDSTRQFKLDVKNSDSLASKMAALANSEGGTIFIGVADDGSIPGLSRQDVGGLISLSAMRLAIWSIVLWLCRPKTFRFPMGALSSS